MYTDFNVLSVCLKKERRKEGKKERKVMEQILKMPSVL